MRESEWGACAFVRRANPSNPTQGPLLIFVHSGKLLRGLVWSPRHLERTRSFLSLRCSEQAHLSKFGYKSAPLGAGAFAEVWL